MLLSYALLFASVCALHQMGMTTGRPNRAGVVCLSALPYQQNGQCLVMSMWRSALIGVQLPVTTSMLTALSTKGCRAVIGRSS